MTLRAGVLEAVLKHELRLVLGQAHGLAYRCRRSPRYRQSSCVNSTRSATVLTVHLPVVGDLVRAELLEGALLGFADSADADLDEALARLDVVIAESDAVGEKLFHRAEDGVVELGVVLIEPLAEVVVALGFEAGDLAGPVEARCAIVALLRVGQIELGAPGAAGDFGLRKIRRRAGQRSERVGQTRFVAIEPLRKRITSCGVAASRRRKTG